MNGSDVAINIEIRAQIYWNAYIIVSTIQGSLKNNVGQYKHWPQYSDRIYFQLICDY